MTTTEQSNLIYLLSKIIKEQTDKIELNEYVIADLRARISEAEAEKVEIT